MSCMGPISAALKSCVNPFDRSMYVATILQAWQTCSSSPLSIVVYLLLVLVAAPAHAEWDTGNTGTGWYQFPGPRNFFDVKREQRSEVRRVGKACVSTCRSRWSSHRKNKNTL